MNKLKLTLIVVVAIVIITVGSIALYLNNQLTPLEEGQAITFNFAKGMTTAELAAQLEQQGIIKNAQVFGYYLRWKGEGASFQAGDYALTPGMSVAELIDLFNRGTVIEQKMKRITIPEGFTVKQIAARLEEKGIVKAKEFLNAANVKTDEFKLEHLTDIPVRNEIEYRMEGYLFPSTYDFKEGTTADQVVERLLQEMDAKLATLPADWKDQMKKLELNMHQMLTIASLIEREVVVDEERPIVAGIVYNRIHANMPLQFCSTVQFLLKEQKERLLYSDLKVDSAYNTYKNAGLPPGPIANPGLESIVATLYPKQTDYLYFVTKEDGTSSHYFGRTYAEHQANIKKSHENLNK